MGERQWREEGDRETKPERETMTLEVTHSYHELPQSERKNNDGLSLPSTARGQPYGHSTFSNPIFCVLHVIICKALVSSENTESRQWLGLVFICTLKLQWVGKLTLKKSERGAAAKQYNEYVDIKVESLDPACLQNTVLWFIVAFCQGEKSKQAL